MQEDAVSSSSHFITLTYDQQNVPCTLFGHLTLSLRDLTLFFKRLRKFHESSKNAIPIKYYAVGEYGGQTERPHYHVILFNTEPELVEKAWQKGDIHYGKVEGASIGYCLKYIMKNRKRFETYGSPDIFSGGIPVGRKKEFAVQSNGLGISYLDETMANWHVEDLINRMYCTVPGGVKIAMPRYYKERLYFELEKAAVSAAYTEQINKKQLEKLDKATPRTVWNQQQAIDAAYDRMYASSLKTTL